MKKKIKIFGLIVALLVWMLLSFFYDNKYVEYYPVFFILIITFLLTERIVTEINIKQKKWDSYGRECLNSRHSILIMILGAMWLWIGIMGSDKDFVWNDLDVRVLYGLFFIAVGIIAIGKPLIIVKKDIIFINGDAKTLELKPDNIRIAEITADKLIFTNGKKEVSVCLNRFSDSEIDEIKLRFGDKPSEESLLPFM